ncbi:DMP19 family protein [Sphingomonas prati]|uniref:DNA mimic protein DMP19 C-terminal domain-containing protein n=1 Tax=Sphingomonas prati TaxID=1843237 RepID=A0A7W9F3V8_9SPHN|nr:DUF4375 domain-containing protein [Sphingomonas prati]MBB5730249.1 hypothetical protein [Sphingomonas prati]GGE92684.1 hypothetical protein GCM10011404_27010 [Sphingomonas prati]
MEGIALVEELRDDWLREGLGSGGKGISISDLRRIPLSFVLTLETEAFSSAVFGTQKQVAAALAAIPPERRHVLALSLLLQGWYAHMPSREAFRHLFYGHWGNAAPEAADALAAAGATRQEEALRKAIALFRSPFPRQQHLRHKLLGEYWGPPTEATSALAELGEVLGPREELVRATAVLVEAPGLSVWFEEACRALKPADRLGWLIDTLLTRFVSGRGTPKKVAALPDPYRALLLAAYAEAEISNGGVHQYMTNSSGTLAPQAVEAFDTIGLPDHAAVIAKAVAMFPDPFPANPGKHQAQQAREAEKRTGEPWSDWDEELAGLTKGWKGRAVGPAIRAYARREGAVPA